MMWSWLWALWALVQFTVTPAKDRLLLQQDGVGVGAVQFGLVVIAGESASANEAIAKFQPANLSWQRSPSGELRATMVSDGYEALLSARPNAEGSLDVTARLTHKGDVPQRAYVAVVRRMLGSGMTATRLRFNGRVVQSGTSPDVWDRDFWYTRGVDWVSWRQGQRTMAVVNGFTPAPTIKPDSVWRESSHFYVWERARQHADTLDLVSEVAGPNVEQAKSKYMPVTPYAAMPAGDTVTLRWRYALTKNAEPTWPEEQLLAFTRNKVSAVKFGVSYFPYSTYNENFDFYRVPGLNQETYWPFSPVMWRDWRRFIPQMQTDFHIIKAMGYQAVRMHHLEPLHTMKQEEALAFIDWYMAQARELGLSVLVDSEGPPEWLKLIASRYGDIVDRFELENEVLIQGVHNDDVERWKTEYDAIKSAAPNAQVFFTGAGNNGMFERIRTLGVPFDRVGLHAYKHGPGWEEAYSSHVLGSVDYARTLGKQVTLGEFNWKNLTRMSPEERLPEFTKIYEAVLSPRAVPEIYIFQFHETLGVNPSIGLNGTRHYESINVDRRPKPEARELIRLMRKYGAKQPLQIDLVETPIRGDTTVTMLLRNQSGAALNVKLGAVAYTGITARVSESSVRIPANGSARVRVVLHLPKDALPGAYHWFLKANEQWGWGIALKQGVPTFDAAPVIADRVEYPRGADVVSKLDWTKPIAVAFGKNASVLELETAFYVAETLQSATGRDVRISVVDDLPQSYRERGTLILVGTPKSNSMINTEVNGTKGVIVSPSRPSTLYLTGATARAAQAAASDFVLRYWKHAKDAAIRVAGMEPGAALGHPAGITNVDLP